eukprot:CFRG2015T1
MHPRMLLYALKKSTVVLESTALVTSTGRCMNVRRTYGCTRTLSYPRYNVKGIRITRESLSDPCDTPAAKLGFAFGQQILKEHEEELAAATANYVREHAKSDSNSLDYAIYDKDDEIPESELKELEMDMKVHALHHKPDSPFTLPSTSSESSDGDKQNSMPMRTARFTPDMMEPRKEGKFAKYEQVMKESRSATPQDIVESLFRNKENENAKGKDK